VPWPLLLIKFNKDKLMPVSAKWSFKRTWLHILYICYDWSYAIEVWYYSPCPPSCHI